MNTPHLQPGAGPLYRQIKQLIMSRIVDGTWPPGECLPSETRLGQELGASQGTVRKALDDLVSENLLVRQQGRGTFVATHTEQRELFHFFHLADDSGRKLLPAHSELISCGRRRAAADEARRLDLARSAHVIAIVRIRHLNARPAIFERICLSAARFPGLEQRDAIPNELYGHYESEFGVTIHRARENLRAVAATAGEAEALGVVKGAPLLEIDRIAETLEGQPVEWRISRCDSGHLSYLTEHV